MTKNQEIYLNQVENQEKIKKIKTSLQKSRKNQENQENQDLWTPCYMFCAIKEIKLHVLNKFSTLTIP